MTDPSLASARVAYTRHEWARCLDLARVAEPEDAAAAAERHVLMAEANWWLGRLEECIDARQGAFEAYRSARRRRTGGRQRGVLHEHHCLERDLQSAPRGWPGRRLLAGAPDGRTLSLQLASWAQHGEGRHADALELSAEAQAMARSVGSADLEAEALQGGSGVQIGAGDTAAGLASLDEAMLSAVEGRLGPYSTGKVYQR
jgi:hypothetical protein